jgi:flagellin
MSFRITSQQTPTLSSLRHQQDNREELGKTLAKLSSGKRIGRAADDAAGLAIASKMGEILKGLEQGMENLNDGLSMLQVADGGMALMSDGLGRMRELATAAASETISPPQREALQGEFDALREEIDRVAASTEFNGLKLLDGSAGSVDVALGEGQAIAADLAVSVDAGALGLDAAALAGANGAAAREAVQAVDDALQQVSARRAELGGTANRMDSAYRNLAVGAENTYAAQSRIMDVDFAVETAELTRRMMLDQMGVASQLQAHGLQATALNLLQ